MPGQKRPGMKNRSPLILLIRAALLVIPLANAYMARADNCPTSADEIATDRPDVTNSSLVVPLHSVQAENGVDWTVRHVSNSLDASNTRLRAGLAHCTEFLIDLPSYFGSLNGSQSSGFSNVVVSFKRQLLVPFGFNLSATAGLGFPSGSGAISGRGYQPYIQFPWSHAIADEWAASGMFTLTWYTNEPTRNPTFEHTFSLEREFGATGDLFAEYAGDYSHQRPSQLLDGGGSWRLTKTQQLDFHAGFGLNTATVDHYFGLGYSIRLDHLLGATFGNSPSP
jgi:hypothetical protein